MLLFSATAFANEPVMAGLYSSPKGFGIGVHCDSSPSSFNSFSLHTDSFGFFSERTKDIGFKFNYSYNFILKKHTSDDLTIQLFVGPGATVGFAHDYETSRQFILFGGDPLTRNMGFTGCLSFTGGVRILSHLNRLNVCLSTRPELGIHIRKDETFNTNTLSWYIMGMIESFYPELVILYRF